MASSTFPVFMKLLHVTFTISALCSSVPMAKGRALSFLLASFPWLVSQRRLKLFLVILLETTNINVLAKSFLFSDSSPSLTFFFLKESHSFISVIEANKAIRRGSSTLGVGYAKFKKNTFSYLNITSLGSDLVQSESQCGLACLETSSCFSYNMAAFPDVNGKLFCEILPSDKYNNTKKLIPSEGHHHFSIAVS